MRPALHLHPTHTVVGFVGAAQLLARPHQNGCARYSHERRQDKPAHCVVPTYAFYGGGLTVPSSMVGTHCNGARRTPGARLGIVGIRACTFNGGKMTNCFFNVSVSDDSRGGRPRPRPRVVYAFHPDNIRSPSSEQPYTYSNRPGPKSRLLRTTFLFLLNEWELIKQRASYSAFQSIYFQALHVVICSFGERYSENSFLGRSKDAPGVAPALAGQAAPPQQKSLRFLAVDGYGRREVLETPGDRKTGMPTQTKIRM